MKETKMPNIIVCYKWVMDDQDIKVEPSSLNLVTTGAKYKISEYDKNALEIGVQLKEQHGGQVEALSFGGTNLKSSLKDVLSRGADCVTWIADACADAADASVTAKVLAAAVKTMTPADLILCGDGSADLYSQQVAQRLAVLLDLPVIDNVEELSFEDGAWVARRQLRDCVETVSVTGPAVISVLPGIAKARIPGMKQILAAGKKPQKALTLAELGFEACPASNGRQTALKGACQQRKNVVIKESSAEASGAALVNALTADGVL